MICSFVRWRLAVSPPERPRSPRLQKHLTQCPGCTRYAQRLVAVDVALGQPVPPPPCPARLHTDIMRQVRTRAAPTVSPSALPWDRLIPAMAVLIIVAATILLWPAPPAPAPGAASFALAPLQDMERTLARAVSTGPSRLAEPLEREFAALQHDLTAAGAFALTMLD